MDCVVYIRWSSTEQGKGSSLERQREDCRRHAAKNGWKIERELVDDGISAFKGQHALTGALGEFVRDVEAGRYPDGVILLCEKLDRLSRQEPSRVFLWLMNLTEAGVIVATVDGARQYSKGKLDMASIIEVIVKAQLSHEESEKKSQRIGAAWASKRRRLEAGETFVMSRRAPAWLTVEGTPPRFVAIPERAAIVTRIFEETAAGFGKHHIARNLNRDGIETFGRSGAWHASYIQKILRSTAVLGEFQPSMKPRGGERQPVGDIVPNYYPAVIATDLFDRARASMAGRSRQVGGRGRRLTNLFSGMAQCGSCRAPMTFRAKGRKRRADGSWVNEDYLICDAYQRGYGCDHGTHYNYSFWQEAILDPIMMEAFRDETFVPQAEVQEVETKLATRQRELEIAKRRAASAKELAINTARRDDRETYVALAEEADRLRRDVARLRAEQAVLRGALGPREHQEHVRRLRAALDDEDEDTRFEARSKVMAAMHGLLADFVFLEEGPTARIDLCNGDRIHVWNNEFYGGPEWEWTAFTAEATTNP